MFLRSGAIAMWCVLLASGCWTGCRRDPAVLEAKFVARGKKMLEAKDYSRAVLEFNNAMKLNPKRADTWYEVSQAYLGAGKLREAVGALRQVLVLEPGHTRAQLKLSELMVQSRDPEVLKDAVKRLDQVLAAEADQPEALDLLALAELKLNRPEDAEEHLQQALDKFPGRLQSSATLAAMQYSRGDHPAAEATLKKAVERAPDSVPAALALAQLYALEKKGGEAEAELRRALGIDPSSSAAWQALAGLQVAQGKLDDADQSYQKLASIPKANLPYIHAAFLLQHGQAEAALREFGKLAAASPRDGAAQLRLAAAYAAASRMPDALSVVSDLLKKNPKDSGALLLRSRMNLQQGKAKEAEADIQQVLHFNPDSVEAHYGLAGVYGLMGRQRLREKELGEVVRLQPGILQARVELANAQISARRADSALATLDAAPQSQKSDLARIQARNWALMAMGRYEEAGAAIDEALRSRASAELLIQRGALAYVRKDYAHARQDAQAVLRQYPQHAGALNLLAQTGAAQKDPTAAIAALRAAAAAAPKSARMQLFAGEWLARLGKPEEARAAYTAAKGAAPANTAADLAMAALDQSQGKNDAAKAEIAGVLAKEPQNQTAMLLMANLEYAAKDETAALKHYRALADLNPDHAVALNDAAYLLATTNPDEALPYAERALEIAPANPMIQDTLGWVYYRKGLYTKALYYLKSAVEKEPSNVRQFHLAMCYLKAGDKLRGTELLNIVLAKDPNLVKTEHGW